MTTVTYKAPRTLTRFLESDAFVRCVVGPVGSGKSSLCVMEILRRAAEQKRSVDGTRRTRFAVIRNTYSQLRDTTRKTFEEWIPADAGTWNEQAFTFHIKRRDMDCEVLFRALDRPEDVKKLLSLELTGAYVNEAREIPKHVLDVLQTRVGRYPSKALGGASWFGIWMDTNPWHPGHWGAKLFTKLGKAEGYELFRQPGGRSINAENVENLPDGYYQRLIAGKDREWINVYVDGQDAVSDEGAIWGAWIADLEKRGGLCAFDHPTTDVFTSWDLGRSDSTAIWFWRLNAKRVPEVIDHYENHGQGLSHYFDVIESKGYTYTKHWLPHDAEAKTLATQQSVMEQCAARFGWQKIALVPNMSIIDGINAARWLMEQPIQIHERCDKPARLEHSGVEALREYRFEWDEESQSYSRNPVHNWASHTADAWRYMAVVVRFSEQITRPPGEVAPVDWEKQPTFRDAVKAYKPKGKARPWIPPEEAAK